MNWSTESRKESNDEKTSYSRNIISIDGGLFYDGLRRQCGSVGKSGRTGS